MVRTVPRSDVAELALDYQGAHADPSPVLPGHCEESNLQIIRLTETDA